jgi:ABC-type nitrate/sulfonate/bicarbonate transport system permease component
MTEMTQLSVEPARKRRLWDNAGMSHYVAFSASLLCALIVWTILAWWVGKPAFLPSPRGTLDGAIELIRNGQLMENVTASLSRIVVGYVIGTCIGIPLGLFMGKSKSIPTWNFSDSFRRSPS